MKKIKWQCYRVIDITSNLGSKRKCIAGLVDEVSAEGSRSTQLEQKARQLELDICTWKSKLSALERLVIQREAQIAELEGLLAKQNTALETVQQDKSSQASKLRQYEKELENCRQHVEPLRQQLNAHKNRLSDLQIQVDERDKTINKLREELRNRERLRTTPVRPAISGKIDQSEERISTASKLFTSMPVQVDDLKRIQGVGPKLERMLNDMGIYQFKQISEFNAQDVKWVDDHLTAFKGRISRDNWVAQAHKLKDEK